ncbi:hypothetical protein AVEN_99072-1 [Araneus ventricosus]|uniref:Uncharacterized protein n=1 Tax=Araneus ventricosus TaxID=182803 RepID=A0A4Y2FNJ2_ARAVE|nr:hypothetical protein AVEN_99072-1 [Araneus ventricosus]
MKETYETLKHMLSSIEYSKHSWHICADLKVIAALVGLQAGYTKFCCSLCQWDSKDRKKHYIKKCYIDLIDWSNCVVTEPPLTMHIKDKDLKEMCKEEQFLALTFEEFPCHKQTVERCV